jgi:hypothetical protein
MKKIKLIGYVIIIQTMIFASCNSAKENTNTETSIDTISSIIETDTTVIETIEKDSVKVSTIESKTTVKKEVTSVLVYNFHLTNRCPSCNAIENGTTKTLNQNFAKELKSGKIKQIIVNLDEEKNAKIAEKYQVFGSGILLVLIKDGKEKTVDLTGDGFKFARNKEDRFSEILSKNITELLK